MRYSKNRRNTATRPIADINVTPLVDVILVLLIIFMVTAPMLQMGIDVNLPRVKAKTVDVGEEKLILTINNKEEIFINKYKTSLTGLKAKLESIFSSRIDREIYMRADKDVPYGFVVRIMSEVRKAGVDKLGMITESPKE
ncbi:MAG TPA: biopolymer transporter ExbD [Syntrophales bacterium]|nr:biopolymer transporter ExbD [Syntrophales bacterium]HPQ44190.1 biopolymer transporter ExbD [Syntrophales bacterium]